MALTQQQLRMMAALLAKKQQPQQQPRGLLSQPLPMEGRFGLLPIKESQPGMGPSVFNKRELALPGLLAGAVNAFTAPGRAMSGQPGFKPEEEGANFAANVMGGGVLGTKPRGALGMGGRNKLPPTVKSTRIAESDGIFSGTMVKGWPGDRHKPIIKELPTAGKDVGVFDVRNSGAADGSPGRDLALSGQMKFDEDLADALSLLKATKESHRSIDLGDSIVALQAKRNGLNIVHMADPADPSKIVSMDLRNVSVADMEGFVKKQIGVARSALEQK
jgi:hypothetical protein